MTDEELQAAIERAVLEERERCIQIATLPRMTPKDIIRVIKEGKVLNPKDLE
jgi:hypothetical protein